MLHLICYFSRCPEIGTKNNDFENVGTNHLSSFNQDHFQI